MPSYKHFHCQIWGDKKFKKLSSLAKLVFIYLFTNDRVTLSGIYEPDLEVAKLLLRLEDFNKFFEEVINSTNVKWDAEKEVIWIINRFKYIPTRSSKVIVGVIDELNTIDHSFKDEFIKKYSEDLKPFAFRLKGKEGEEANLLTEYNIRNLRKIYPDNKSIKNFLSTKGYDIEKIDTILKRVL